MSNVYLSCKANLCLPLCLSCKVVLCQPFCVLCKADLCQHFSLSCKADRCLLLSLMQTGSMSNFCLSCKPDLCQLLCLSCKADLCQILCVVQSGPMSTFLKTIPVSIFFYYRANQIYEYLFNAPVNRTWSTIFTIIKKKKNSRSPAQFKPASQFLL